MMEKLTKEKFKVCLIFSPGEYYGDSYSWDYFEQDQTFNYTWFHPKVDTKDARLYTIATIKNQLDSLSKFVKPSVLLDFIKTIGDPNTGEELWNNLQDNLLYIFNLSYYIASVANITIMDKFRKLVWGQFISYNTEDECHICLFDNQNGLVDLLKPHNEFVEFFKEHLKQDIDSFLLIYDDKTLKEARIKELEQQIADWEKEIKNLNNAIKNAKTQIVKLKKE